MSITFRPAVRENVPLLIGLAGGTGSGKSFSALRIATGLAGDQRFCVIDTENGRAKHYADRFQFDVGDLRAPFRPAAYTEAINAADKAGYPVIVVDSASHEWAGDGGCLDWHDELQGGDLKKNLSAWIKPKGEHKKMVTALLQVRAHVILCFRAEPKVEMVGNKIVPKPSLTGLDGWIPISEKNLPYELTVSFLLMADRPGVPKPIKLPEQITQFVPLNEPLSESTGRALGEWAKGSAGEGGSPSQPASGEALGKPTPAPADPPFSSPADKPASAAKRKKLDKIATDLIEGGHINSEQIGRSVGVELAGSDGWPQLLERLNGGQADELIGRLERFQKNLKAAA